MKMTFCATLEKNDIEIIRTNSLQEIIYFIQLNQELTEVPLQKKLLFQISQ